MTTDERDAATSHGHKHGVLRRIVDHMSNRRSTEPSYSPMALMALVEMARDGLPDAQFEMLAEALEGEKGAPLVAATASKPNGAALIEPNDMAEPDRVPVEAPNHSTASAPGNDTRTEPSHGQSVEQAVNTAETEETEDQGDT